MNCISCSMVCKIIFGLNHLIFRMRLAESQEEEEHKQLQSVWGLTQTQKELNRMKAYCSISSHLCSNQMHT